MAPVYKIRHGIETAVSVPVVASESISEETGETVQLVEEQIFLPGAVLPENLADYFIEKIENEDEHVTSFVEVVEQEKPKAAAKPAPKKTEAKASAAAKKTDDDNPFAASGE